MTITTPPDAPERPSHDGHGAPAEARQRLAVLLFIGVDAVFVVCLLFSYYYLRGLNTDGNWLVKGAHAEAAWATWVIALIAVASAAVLHWGEQGIDEGDNGRVLLGITGALLLVVADIVGQVWQLATLKGHLSDGSYASAFRVLIGYHLVHLLLLAFLGFGLLNRARAGVDRSRAAVQVRLVRYFWDWVAVAAVLTAITTWFVTSPRA